MENPLREDIADLLRLAEKVRSRLRQLDHDPNSGSKGDAQAPDAAAVLRSRSHLELALEALGEPIWGFASPAASSNLRLTGFYSTELYKGLRELRNRGAVEEGLPSGDSPTTESSATTPGAAGNDEEPESEGTWVKSRCSEIQRALTAAFGEEEMLPDETVTPKPFSTPEFVGNTDTLAVPELVGFFQQQGKTGVLTVDSPTEQFTLEYLRGDLIHVASNSSPKGQRLGDFIVRLGHVTESTLERLLASKARTEMLGEVLRRGDVITEEALSQALDAQVQSIFLRLAALRGCRFAFREGLEGEPRARVRYNITRLLLETARQQDELERSARAAS